MITIRFQKFIKKYATPAMWLSGGLTAIALVLSKTGGQTAANVLFLLATLLTGFPILVRAIQGLRFRTVGIECLVSIAVLGACWIGEFSEGAIVTFLFQFGSFLEQKTLTKTRGAIKALTKLAPTTAWRMIDGEPEEIDADEVEEGDRLLVKTGGKIAADGVVVQGEGHVNEASITGESVPLHKTPGDKLYAGTILESGTLEMEALKVGEDTTFSRIIQLVEEAQDAKSPAERFIDRFARYYTPAVVVLACPGALVIGAPIANVAGIGRGAQEGVLLKGGEKIDTYAKTDTFVFDKTGTLTVGHPQVIHSICYDGEEGALLTAAASAELSSDHPLAKAIVEYAKAQGCTLAPLPDVQTRKGLGLSADFQGKPLRLGSEKLLTAEEIRIPRNVAADIQSLQAQGATTALLAVDGMVRLLLGISDALRPDAAETMQQLRKLGIRNLVMLTGDNPATANAIAAQAGITEVNAQLLPQDKVDWVRQMQQAGRRVTFVGDGINDSPALIAADTGIAIGSGTDVAIDCSDVILMKSGLGGLVQSLRLAKRTVAVLRQNIAIAVGTVVLLLIGLFAGFVHMSVGMLIHEASILVVIFNAMRLLIHRKGE